MMQSIDLFCAADDQHRVKLLAEVLGDAQQALQAGQTVKLRAGPVAEPSNPCLVACTARALRAPWIRALFRVDHTVVAIRLDDTPLPGPCTRRVDIQTWPARSADSAVEALAVWLQNLKDGGTAHASRSAGVADAAPARDSPGGEVPSGTPRVRPAPARSDLKRGLLLLGLVVGGLGLLWLSAQRQSPAPADHAEQAPDTAAAAAPASGAYGAEAGRGSVDDAAMPLLPAPLPLPVPAATAGYADALDHLCRAQTPAAARAWAGVLDWKQQRRAAQEPCVRALLERPGFEALEALLDLS